MAAYKRLAAYADAPAARYIVAFTTGGAHAWHTAVLDVARGTVTDRRPIPNTADIADAIGTHTSVRA